MPNFILLPRAAEELTIPFVASGGMADGRSRVAALALGADGINMGTRFIAALTFADIVHDVSGVDPRIMQQGDMDAGVWSCGMVAGLIHDVPTVKELIDRIMAEAETIIRQRLMGALTE